MVSRGLCAAPDVGPASGDQCQSDHAGTDQPEHGRKLGVQLVTSGLLAEMVTRTYFESQDKPIYTVREELGLAGDMDRGQGGRNG